MTALRIKRSRDSIRIRNNPGSQESKFRIQESEVRIQNKKMLHPYKVAIGVTVLERARSDIYSEF